MTTWTDKQIELLREFYGNFPNVEVAELIGKTKQAIQHKAHRLGLTTKLVAEYKHCKDCGVKLSRASIYKESAKRCFGCAMTHHSGENHHNWNGGVAELRSIVHCLLKPLWIDPIMRRDNFSCTGCGCRGGDLVVHHVRPFVEIRDYVMGLNPKIDIDSFDGKKAMASLIVAEHKMSDGVTLCVSCHKLIHYETRGELLETPNASGEDNQQPSRSNVINLVDRKVQRLMGEESQTNKPDTSAPQAKSLGWKI